MGANQASMARRQRERARQQRRREKMAKRMERRAQKTKGLATPDDPMNDPTIDWGDAVRETEVVFVGDSAIPAEPGEETEEEEDT